LLTIGSLFSGIGGLELGLEWAGLGPVVWQCEIDPFCREVLAKHWPHVERFTDVTRPRSYPPAELLCGGFPCQDVSSAGYGRGLGGPRSGLWWHFARVIRQVRPRVVVVENVASGAKRWLLAVSEALGDLGYRTRALGIGAADVGALHRRKRVFVIAYAPGLRREARKLQREQTEGRAPTDADATRRDLRVAPHAHRDGELSLPFDAEMAGTPTLAPDADGSGVRIEQGRRRGEGGAAREEVPTWARGRFAEPEVVRMVHGLPRGLDGARRKSLGNCVVPQCAQVVGEVIREMLQS
jgi:DNA (cytosine-5)-methyltransferase 1